MILNYQPQSSARRSLRRYARQNEVVSNLYYSWNNNNNNNHIPFVSEYCPARKKRGPGKDDITNGFWLRMLDYDSIKTFPKDRIKQKRTFLCFSTSRGLSEPFVILKEQSNEKKISHSLWIREKVTREPEKLKQLTTKKAPSSRVATQNEIKIEHCRRRRVPNGENGNFRPSPLAGSRG